MKLVLLRYLPCLAIVLLMSQAFALVPIKEEPHNELSCNNNPALQKMKSAELVILLKQDQSDREKFSEMTPEAMLQLAKNDLTRREKVGLIFAEGCLNSALDYQIAGLIFQHGESPDHYYQAYIWANKAAEIEKSPTNSLASLAIDRYLISIGKKQLFASQFLNPDIMNPASCYCMQQVEPSFPNSKRKNYSGRSLKESYEILELFNKGKICLNQHAECEAALKPTLKGSIPGLW
jgi:hypothetical protein